MSLKAGIIGCGGIARSHVDAYQKEGLTIAAVTDCATESANTLSRETNGAKVFADFRELIDHGGVDVVSICTPPVAHEAAACYALERGVHVLCEKPMAYDVASAQRMAAAASRSQAKFMPAFRHRFLPANVALRTMVRSGRIGYPVLFNNIFCGPAFHMEGRWFTRKAIAGGGSLLDTNSHSVDLFRFIVGEIADQRAVMHRHFRTTDVEDAGILSVKAANGAVGAMESAFVAGAGCAFIDVLGTRGRAHYDYFEADKIKWRLTEDSDWRIEPVEPSNGFREQIRHFLGAIQDKHELTCTAQDGLRCMEVICSVYGG